MWNGRCGARIQSFGFVVVLLTLFGSAPASAGPEPDQGPPPGGATTRPVPSPDFWFGQPRASVGVRGSWLFAREGSDFFTFVQDQFTIDSGDFNAPGIAVDVGVAISRRADVVFGFEYSGASSNSEYRDFVDNNRLPITQESSLHQINLTGSLKFALTPRGRPVSQLAWIPSTVMPYAGGGAGFMWYRLDQQGDFVDFVDFSVFPARFQSDGWTPSAHVFAGTDINVWKHLFVSVEGRYTWAAADLDRDFTGFEPLDLSGFKFTAGVNFLF
jgi:opacity protein-like surface antigen